MAGTDIMKENLAATILSSPAKRPPTMVDPERETPGRMATACMPPMARACFTVMSSTLCLLCRRPVRICRADQASATKSSTAVRRKQRPSTSPELYLELCMVMKSSSSSVAATAGSVATTSIQNTWFLKGFFRMAHQSFQNTTKTAPSVPRCSRMFMVRLGSATPSSFCASSRCPLELTGRNSVSPCNIPRKIACKICNPIASQKVLPVL